MTTVAPDHATTPPAPTESSATSFDRWRASVQRPTPMRAAALLAVVVGAAALIMLAARRPRHWWGDDWALYLRQAEGLLDGNPGRVAAENRFNIDQALGPPFSPPLYPWGFPVVLVAFVAVFGDDLDSLALVSTLAACVFACCWYALARPRLGEIAALLGAFAVVTSPLLLLWSELIQSEWTFLAVVGLVFVGLDRLIASGSLIDTTRSVLPLVALGIGAAAAFSVRREGFALTPAVATAQLVALQAAGGFRRPWPRGSEARRLVARLMTPHAAALGVVVAVLIGLPSTLVPSYDGTSVKNVGRFADQHIEHIAEISGVKNPWDDAPMVLGNVTAGWIAMGLYLLAGLIGIVLAVTVNRRRDAQFVCYIVVALLIGGSFRSALNRYMASIAPILVLLGLVALTAAARRVDRRSLRPAIVLVPLTLLVAGNIVQAVDRIDRNSEFEADGRVEWGPAHPDALAMFDAVVERTDDDAIVGAYKARALTWATGRRSVQVGTPWRIPATIEFDAVVLETGDPMRSELDASAGWVQTWTGRRFVMYEPAEG